VAKLVGAINYLHTQKIMHCDLKFENIMLEDESEDAQIKVIDFGLSRKFRKGQRLRGRVGTTYTMSPEVFRKEYDKQADMWSIGVIAFMLLSGEKPFWGENTEHVREQVMNADYNFDAPAWKGVSMEAKEFISYLLQVDPSKRYTATDALRSPWLTEFAKRKTSTLRPSVVSRLYYRMDEFSTAGEFRKLALQAIAHKATSEEIVKLRKVFDAMDEEKDGEITLHNMKNALCSQYSEKEIEDVFRGIDVDSSGTINYTEFIAATLEEHGRIEEQRIAEAFDLFDVEGKGHVSSCVS
jgi:calcium-dependent protein kinase